MNPYAWGIVASIFVYLVVGNWAGRKVKHLDDYYVAGRQASTLLVIGTLVASLLSTAAFLGEVGMAYMGFGAVVLVLVVISCTGYVAGALTFGRHLRRSRALTVPEYFGRRFTSPRVQAAAGLTVIVGLGAYLVAVTQGAALVVSQVSELSYPVALAIVWGGYTVFTLNAGSRGVVITDTLMFLLFALVGFTALGFVIHATGGWFASVNALANFAPKPGVIAWHGAIGPGATWQTPGDALTWALILGFSWAVVVAVSPWQASRYLMARNEQTVMRAACGSTLVLVCMYPLLLMCAAAVNLANPAIEPPESTLLWAAQHLMPAPAGVALTAGVMAAGLSSATTFLSLVGFSASHDVRPNGGGTDRSRLRLSRMWMLVVSLAALGLALSIPPRIFWITYFAGTVFASSWGPVAVMSVWSRRITADAAFWGIVAGFAGNVIPKALDLLGLIDLPVWADPILIGVIVSVLVIHAVSRAGHVSEAQHEYRRRLHRVPDEELDPVRISVTLRWTWAMAAGGVALTTGMIVFWALPHARAVGAGEFAWLSGETAVSVLCGLVLLGSAAAIRRHLGRMSRGLAS